MDFPSPALPSFRPTDATAAPTVDEDSKENTEPSPGQHTKMDIFLKLGSPGGVSSEGMPPPSPSFRHTIMQRVTTPCKGVCRREGSGGLRSSAKVCVGERVVEV